MLKKVASERLNFGFLPGGKLRPARLSTPIEEKSHYD
jgi:hypothetical protein